MAALIAPRGQRWAIMGGLAVALLVLALAIVGSYALTLHIISTRNHIWCPVLATLTSRPPPADATPADRRAFAELARIRDGFGC